VDSVEWMGHGRGAGLYASLQGTATKEGGKKSGNPKMEKKKEKTIHSPLAETHCGSTIKKKERGGKKAMASADGEKSGFDGGRALL